MASEEHSDNPEIAGKNISIPEPVHAAFRAFCKKRRIEMKASAGQVLVWLMRQPPPVQSAVLGIQDGMDAAYADVLESIARDLRKAKAKN